MYVKTVRTPDMPAPPIETGVIGWLHHNLFSSWLNAVMTVAGLPSLHGPFPISGMGAVQSQLAGDSRTACVLPDGNPAGACWVFVKVRLGLLMYGFYPESERWRIDFVFLLLAASAGPLLADPLLPARWRGRPWPADGLRLCLPAHWR